MKTELYSASILLMISVQFKFSDGFVIQMPITSYSGDNMLQQLPTGANRGETFWLIWFPDKFYLVKNGVGKYVRTLEARPISRTEWAPLKKTTGSQWQNRNGRSAKSTNSNAEIQKRAAVSGNTDSSSDTLSSSRYPRKTTKDNTSANLVAPGEQRKTTRSLSMDDYDFNAWEDGVKMRQAKPAGVKRLERSIGFDSFQTNQKTPGETVQIEASPEVSQPRIARQGLEFSGGFRIPSLGDFIPF